MRKPRISMIAVIGANTRALGMNNQLLWHISEDLKRFKSITSGHPVIMGRVTYESIGKPLPGRTNIIVTRNEHFKADGCKVSNSVEDAIELAKEMDDEEIFIIGGAEIYRLGMPYANRLYLTLVDSDKAGDVYFPEYYNEFTKVVEEEQSFQEGLSFTYIILERE